MLEAPGDFISSWNIVWNITCNISSSCLEYHLLPTWNITWNIIFSLLPAWNITFSLLKIVMGKSFS